jgi:hypothetical protein
MRKNPVEINGSYVPIPPYDICCWISQDLIALCSIETLLNRGIFQFADINLRRGDDRHWRIYPLSKLKAIR